MDQLDNSNAFDQAISTKVYHAEVAQKSEWSRLQAALIVQERRLRQIQFGKVLELCFLFLLATTWIQYDHDLHYREANKEILGARQIYSNQKQDPATEKQSKINTKSTLAENEVMSQNNRIFSSTNTTNISTEELSAFKDNQESKSMAEISPTINTSDNVSLSTYQQMQQQATGNFSPVMEFLSPLEIAELEITNAPKQVLQGYMADPSVFSSALTKGQVQRPSFSLAFAIGRDRDLIRTPYPAQQSVHHLGRIERNYHWELHALMQLGNIEYHTGIQYWQKKYSSVYEGANQAYMLSIPLGLKLYLSKEGTVRPYLMGGGSAHLVTRANYNDEEAVRAVAGEDFLQNNFQARSPGILSTGDFENGILEGESFKGNHYFTATMGIGIDIPIHPQWSLFFEQIYTHHLQGGIGPAFDKFSSSSTNAGIKFHFRK